MRALLSPVRSLLRPWAWSFLVWGLMAAVLVGQLVWVVSFPLRGGLFLAARELLPWAVVSPLLFRLVARWPLERARWRVAVPVHLVGAAVVFALAGGWSALLPPPPLPPGVRLPPVPEMEGPDAPPAPLGRRVLLALFPHLPLYLVVLSVAHAQHFYRRAVAREGSLTQARLAALRGQLQPHFLFNSLNAIAELVHRDPDAADAMLVALSDLLRLSLETTDEQLLPLGRELEGVQRYLAIEHARFGDRLHFELDVPPDTRGALVPAFLLQPLVENAVRHGLEPRAGAGRLTVRARRDGALLRLAVEDDGVGLGGADDGQPVREGVGLANTRARLHALFDGTARLDLRRGGVRGLTVEVALPFRPA